MTVDITPELRALLEGPNVAHLASLRKDGSPASHPVWIGFDGQHILICTGPTTAKTRNVERDPRVTLSVLNHDNPYEEAMIRGTVVEVRNDDQLADMDPISIVYTGKPFPYRDPPRVTLVIEPTKVDHRTLPFRPADG
jgi:PPOX class probable F420-dependent enzyme